MATTIPNVFSWPHNLGEGDNGSSKTRKYLKKKNGTIVGLVLKEIKKQDHPVIKQCLGRFDDLENADEFSRWYKTTCPAGFQPKAGANFLCDGLRYFGIWESLTYDRWGTSCNYCLPENSLINKLGPESYKVLQDITSDPPANITLFGQKWNRSTKSENGSVASCVYTATTDDKSLLGIVQTHKNKFDEWRTDPQVQGAEAQNWVLKAPTMLCITPAGGTKIKDIHNEKVKEAMLGFGVGWTEETECRATAAALNSFLITLGDKLSAEEE